MESNEIMKGLHYEPYSNPFHHHHHFHPPYPTTSFSYEIFSSPNTSCQSNGTVLDSAEQNTPSHDHHEQKLIHNIMNDRKMRRMISNRESARRSRMRKKKQIEGLEFQVGQLEALNRQLSEKLIDLLECNQQILHENAELKEKVSSLQLVISDLLIPVRSVHHDDILNCSGNNRLKAVSSISTNY